MNRAEFVHGSIYTSSSYKTLLTVSICMPFHSFSSYAGNIMIHLKTSTVVPASLLSVHDRVRTQQDK